MPIHKGSVSFTRFSVVRDKAAPKDAKAAVINALRKWPFEPVDPSAEQDHSEGFVEIEDHDETAMKPGSVIFGEHALVAFRRDRLRVPAPLLRREVERGKRDFEEKRGRKASRAEIAEIKEMLARKLKAKMVPSSRFTEIAYDLRRERVYIASASAREVEHVQGVLMEALGLELVLEDATFLAKGATLSPLGDGFGRRRES